ncbi:MAG TPA: hypothetical protein EYP65_00525 [Armatimonadetes bacterium]|nr:hypothetical protein [Armatimonadota bacterium]
MAVDYERIRRLIEEEIRRQLRKEGATSPKVLFLVCAGRGEVEAIYDQIGEVARKAEGVAVLLSHSAEEVFNLRGLTARAGEVPVLRASEVGRPEALLEEAKVVCLAVPSLNTVAKVATGIEDSVPSAILGLAIGRGVPVVVCQEGALSEREMRSPRAMLFRRHLSALSMQGARVVPASQLARAVLGVLAVSGSNPGPLSPWAGRGRPVVTEAMVLEAIGRGEKVLRVPGSAIVTPLAEETAKLRGLKIERAD